MTFQDLTLGALAAEKITFQDLTLRGSARGRGMIRVAMSFFRKKNMWMAHEGARGF